VACGEKRGGCQCGNVWSVPADFPVTSGMQFSAKENNGEGWKDGVAFTNATFIAHAREDVPWLLAALDAAHAALRDAAVVVERMANGASRQACSPEFDRFHAAVLGLPDEQKERR
jgi:hypothetical protein